MAELGEPPADRNGIGNALRAYGIRELRVALNCLAWRPPRLHAGVHQARKSLRRVRATLALADPEFGRGGRILDRELQRTIRSFSKLRDGQALVETLERLLLHDFTPEQAALLKRAERAASRRRAELGRESIAARGAGFPEDQMVLVMLLGALKALPWSQLSPAVALSALANSATREMTAGQRAMDSGNDDDWHCWRRRARRLSQQHRALAGVVDQPGDTRERDKTLAVLLGEVQDFALLADHCGKRSPFLPADRQPIREFAMQGLRHKRTQVTEIIASRPDRAPVDAD